MTTVGIAGYQQWNPNDHKYKCCCNSCHVKTGTKVIGILSAIQCGFQLFGIISALASSEGLAGYMIGQIVSVIVLVIALVFLFLGLKRERHGYLLPYMVLQIIGIVFLLIAVVVCIVAAAVGGGFLIDYMDQNPEAADRMGLIQDIAESMVTVCVIAAVVCALAAALNIWLFLVVLSCYRYFKDKQFYEMNMMTTVNAVHYGQPTGYGLNNGYGQAPGYGQPIAAYGNKP